MSSFYFHQTHRILFLGLICNKFYKHPKAATIVFKETPGKQILLIKLLVLSCVFLLLQNITFNYFESMASTSEREKPHITFGIIADVQYADCDDGTDFSKTRERFYRNALNLLKNAINDWKRSDDPVAFVLQLGDLIDGKNNIGGETSSKKALSTALNPFNSLHIPVYHVIGNHELYNLNRSFYLTSALNSSLSLSIETSKSNLYYTFLPHPKLRIVALDTYEVSLLGYRDNPEDENYKTAQLWFQQNNKNEDINDVSGLDGLSKRWAAYNGGVSERQLLWLSQVLQKAQSKEENVIIITHIAIQCEDRDYAICLAWNYDEIMNIIRQYPCVIGVFAGHEHAGWDFLDEHGIQHITFQGVIETRPGGNAYATARLWDERLTVTGLGRVPSCNIRLRFPI
ncbi:manganese-dependent ADP-ribose/CDP-alcohol diphosphatase [Biomphalaria pfeifferi]|uniref:Manganese-dependent ADP-ribose/CDP-alcohol diphosphatase n=1 Tax=Biomphalaria pfeifferi TaxID=112525 RepID=A0AAD8B318_BIOPF|nr:manganese-dependent ADP-ribose/CDP-alcohol diphosphatase [Biomphalaria pfeifferi]